MSTIAADLGRLPGKPGWRENGRRLRTLAIETFVVAAALFSEMPFLDHLDELRNRILKSIAALIVALLFCMTYAVQLIDFLSRPVLRIPGMELIAVSATEIYSLYFKGSFTAAVCLAAPVILWQVWRFIAPGLHRHEKRYAAPFLISTTVAFIGGAVFGFLVLVPLMLQLTVSMAEAIHIKVMMSALSYLDMVSMIVLSMGVVFEIPPVIFVLSRIGIVNARFLARNFKYAILISFVAAAVLTPSQDVTPMLLVALPMVALYAIGILVAFMFGKPRQAEA